MPAGVVTDTPTSPAAWGGVTAEIERSDSTVNAAGVPPIVTAVAPENPVPVIVTAVPPLVGPVSGATRATTGGSTGSGE